MEIIMKIGVILVGNLFNKFNDHTCLLQSTNCITIGHVRFDDNEKLWKKKNFYDQFSIPMGVTHFIQIYTTNNSQLVVFSTKNQKCPYGHFICIKEIQLCKS